MFQPFPKIPSVDRFIKDREDLPPEMVGTGTFIGTVKLHGTNAAIVLSSDQANPYLAAQSRSRILTPEQDNYAFALYVQKLMDRSIHNEELHTLCAFLVSQGCSHVYGEWVGQGIQSKVAVSRGTRQFVPFATRRRGIVHPLLTVGVSAAGVHRVLVSLQSQEDLKRAVSTLETFVPEVEKQCPYGSLLGLDGPGEGIVWVYVPQDSDEELATYDNAVKTKGTAHHGTRKPKRAPKQCTDQATLESLWLTYGCDERLESILVNLRGQGIQPELKHVPLFVKKFTQDFITENPGVLDNKQLRRDFSKYAIAAYKESL